MISRMHPAPGANGDGGGEGSRIAIVYNGSPLFSGDAGSGPPGTALPLPMDFGPDKPNAQLVETFKATIDAYIASEVLPHVPDAWVDYEKTKVGYEIPINRHFYVYKPPRPLAEIEADIARLEGEIADLLQGLAG
jgi:hypothetical protein